MNPSIDVSVPNSSEQNTFMYREAAEAPDVVARLLHENRSEFLRVGSLLRKHKPRLVVTGARGSSDHAATFAKYLIETRLSVLTSSIGLSVGSIYNVQSDFSGTLFLAISQSGQSPDLIASAQKAKTGGAFVVAIVNDGESPLARLADHIIPLFAGTEKSVAATKTYLASAAAVAALVAVWSQDDSLTRALDNLPNLMRSAWEADWNAAIVALEDSRDLYVIGRGTGFGCAQEVALKFKETCGLHAEAFSAAEVLHGPMALVKTGFPVLLLSQNDETRIGEKELAAKLRSVGATVLLAGFEQAGAINLPAIGGCSILEPILLAQSAYRMINMLSLRRGLNPDHPPNLTKVTETV